MLSVSVCFVQDEDTSQAETEWFNGFVRKAFLTFQKDFNDMVSLMPAHTPVLENFNDVVSLVPSSPLFLRTSSK